MIFTEAKEQELPMDQKIRELYGRWIVLIHVAQAKVAECKPEKDKRAWKTTAAVRSECARDLRATFKIDQPEPHEIPDRQPSESQQDYQRRVGYRHD